MSLLLATLLVLSLTGDGARGFYVPWDSSYINAWINLMNTENANRPEYQLAKTASQTNSLPIKEKDVSCYFTPSLVNPVVGPCPLSTASTYMLVNIEAWFFTRMWRGSDSNSTAVKAQDSWFYSRPWKILSYSLPWRGASSNTTNSTSQSLDGWLFTRLWKGTANNSSDTAVDKRGWFYTGFRNSWLFATPWRSKSVNITESTSDAMTDDGWFYTRLWKRTPDNTVETTYESGDSKTAAKDSSWLPGYLYRGGWFISAEDPPVVDIPYCSEKKTFLCPNLKDKFQAKVCCDSNWLAKGAKMDTGDECMIDLNEMEVQCEIRTCYKNYDSEVPGYWNTDGCTYSPDYFLSYEACVLHDLCYVTPGTSKKECDDAMEENINKIYCEHVNYRDSYACTIRSRAGRWANKVMSYTDYYFHQSEDTRTTCVNQDGYIRGTWKYFLRSVQSLY